MNKSSLGLIETYGFIGAVAALDTAAKAANIELVSCEFVKGGIVTILITGEVASVKAAVEASEAETKRLGVLLNTHVIARADEDVWKVLDKEKDTEEDAEINEDINNDLSNKVNGIEADEEMPKVHEEVGEITPLEEIQAEEDNEDENLDSISCDIEKIKDLDLMGIIKSREELEKLKVMELRTLARQMKEFYKISLTKKQIKFSKKEQLIEAILKGN